MTLRKESEVSENRAIQIAVEMEINRLDNLVRAQLGDVAYAEAVGDSLISHLNAARIERVSGLAYATIDALKGRLEEIESSPEMAQAFVRGVDKFFKTAKRSR